MKRKVCKRKYSYFVNLPKEWCDKKGIYHMMELDVRINDEEEVVFSLRRE